MRQKQQEEEQRRRHREKLQRETGEKQRQLQEHQKQIQAEQRQQQVEEQKKKERQQQQQQMDEESLHRQQQHNYQDEPEQGQINEQEEAVKAEVAISAAAAQISSPLVCGDPFDDFDDVEALLRMAGNGYDENVFALLRAAGVDDAEGLARRMASEDMDVEALKLCSEGDLRDCGTPSAFEVHRRIQAYLYPPIGAGEVGGGDRQGVLSMGVGDFLGMGALGLTDGVTKANAFISQQLGMSPSPLPPPRRSGLEVPASFSSYPPEELCCPITQEILFDPVRAADGYVYERAAIEGWIQTKSLLSEPGIPSPIANVALPHLRLDPVPKKKMQADAWRVANYGRY